LFNNRLSGRLQELANSCSFRLTKKLAVSLKALESWFLPVTRNIGRIVAAIAKLRRASGFYLSWLNFGQDDKVSIKGETFSQPSVKVEDLNLAQDRQNKNAALFKKRHKV
jgi:hypothetical protein